MEAQRDERGRVEKEEDVVNRDFEVGKARGREEKEDGKCCQ